MKKKAYGFCVLIVACSLFLLAGCDLLNKGTSSSYTFEWHCTYANYIDIRPSHGGSPSSFRLSASNKTVTVTWDDEGEDYYGGFESTSNYPSGKKAPWFERYDSLKEVCFYDY